MLLKPAFDQQVFEAPRGPAGIVHRGRVKRHIERHRDPELTALFEHLAHVFGRKVRAVEMFPHLIGENQIEFAWLARLGINVGTRADLIFRIAELIVAFECELRPVVARNLGHFQAMRLEFLYHFAGRRPDDDAIYAYQGLSRSRVSEAVQPSLWRVRLSVLFGRVTRRVGDRPQRGLDP